MGLLYNHAQGDCPCAARTLVDCGCVAHVYGNGSGHEIIYCDRHRAGFTLVERLNPYNGPVPVEVRAAYERVIAFAMPESAMPRWPA